MKALREWSIQMRGFAKGLATLSNIIYDVKNSRLPRSVISSFLRRLMMLWQARDLARFHRPEDLIAQVTEADPHRYFCRGPKVTTPKRQCSRIMIAQDFFENNVLRPATPFSLSDRPNRRQIQMLEHLGLRNVATNKMQTRRPYAWITQTESLQQAGTGHPNQDVFASAVITMLGLDHFRGQEYIVEIRYPPDFMDREQIYAPTFLEGSPSLIYMSKDNPDGWGKAVRLDTAGEGLPEAIHRATQFDSNFSVKYVGRMLPTISPCNWAELIKKMPLPWKPAMVKTLEAYV